MNQSEEDKQQSKLELKVRTFTGIIRESKKKQPHASGCRRM